MAKFVALQAVPAPQFRSFFTAVGPAERDQPNLAAESRQVDTAGASRRSVDHQKVGATKGQRFAHLPQRDPHDPSAVKLTLDDSQRLAGSADSTSSNDPVTTRVSSSHNKGFTSPLSLLLRRVDGNSPAARTPVINSRPSDLAGSEYMKTITELDNLPDQEGNSRGHDVAPRVIVY